MKNLIFALLLGYISPAVGQTYYPELPESALLISIIENIRDKYF